MESFRTWGCDLPAWYPNIPVNHRAQYATLANITFIGEPSLGTIVTMASVSSLDKDMRNLRLGKYTPQAANEVREWIEEVLGERMAAGDLLEALKDGSVLCKYGSTP